ncbi:MAG: hypothetical protein JOY57_14850 [Actinobacteria bacterium]|nr:hypothetical protein [Actinomycetota bacterium]
MDDAAVIAPEWLDPETPPWSGPDAGLPTLYEYVESAGPFIGRDGPAAYAVTAPTVLAPRSGSPLPDRGARTEEAAGATALAVVAAPETETEPELEGEPEPEREPSVLRQLALVPEIEGPHVRMALAWAVVTVTAAVIGKFVLAAWLAAVALVAAGQVVRSWRKRPVRPTAPVVVFGAALIPIGTAVGTIGLAVAAGVVVVAALLAPLVPVSAARRRARDNSGLTVAFALGLGMAAAAPVIARQRGLVPTLVLLTMVGVYDASAYVVGAGASNVWEGPAAGAAFVGAVTLLVAAIFVPPFTGASPWILGAIAAVLAPFGPVAGSLILGERGGAAQAVRRLDSLLVAGPVWAAASLVLLKP